MSIVYTKVIRFEIILVYKLNRRTRQKERIRHLEALKMNSKIEIWVV